MHNFIIFIKQQIINSYNYLINKFREFNFGLIYQQYRSMIFMVAILFLLIIFNHVIKYIFNFKPKVHQNLVVKTQAAIKKDLPITIHPSGKVNTISSVTIFPQTEGVLLNAYFNEGVAVKQGQLLFEIDPALLQVEYNNAKANLEKVNADLHNIVLKLQKSTKLYQKNFISSLEQEQAIANFETAKANQQVAMNAVDASKIRLNFTKIYAPISGVTGEILIKPGTVIKTGNQSGLVNIKQLDPINVFFYISEEYLSELLKNINSLEQLKIKIPDLNKQGKLVFFNNQVDHLNGTILVKAEFCNKDLKLWPGQFVNLDLNIKNLYGVIVIPSIAVQTGQEGSYVYIAKIVKKIKDKQIAKIIKKRVKTGTFTDQETVITAGLNPGDLVVTEGYSNLSDQMMVEIYVP